VNGHHLSFLRKRWNMLRADKEEKEADSTFVQFAIRTFCDKKNLGTQ
jgi:hypothetical protein